MTWAPSETQKTIYTTLAADAALQTLLGTTPAAPKVFDSVPDETAYPYVKLMIKPTTNRDNESYDGVEINYQISVWNRGDEGDKKTQAIQQRIEQLLLKKDAADYRTDELCIDGWNVVSHSRTLIDIAEEPDGRTRHGIQTFNLMLGEA